jgi:hypothetical protein
MYVHSDAVQHFHRHYFYRCWCMSLFEHALVEDGYTHGDTETLHISGCCS